jgi:hypothetical protein
MGITKFPRKIGHLIKKKIIVLLIAFTMLSVIFCGWFLFGTEHIGDWYVKENEPQKAMYWYEFGYNLWDKKESLVKLCDIAYVINDYEKQLEYLPIIIKSDEYYHIVSEIQYDLFLNSYISSLYLSGKKDEYKQTYEAVLDKFNNSTSRLQPIEMIIDDSESKSEDFSWAINLGSKILENYNNEPGSLILLYNQQSDLYSKLGNNLKARELKIKAENIRQTFLK